MRFSGFCALMVVLLLVGTARAAPLLPLGPASSDVEWRLDSVGAAAKVYSTDAGLQRRTGTVAFFTRIDYATAQVDAKGRRYQSGYSAVILDCSAGAYFVFNLDTYDPAGRLVASYATPPGKAPKQTVQANSASDSWRRRYCAANAPPSVAAPPQPPTEAILKIGPATTAVDWRLDLANGDGKVYSTATDISYAKDGSVVFYSRVDLARPAPARFGGVAQADYMLVVIDCARRAYAVVAYDAYDEDGRLVDSNSLSVDQVQLRPIASGEAADVEAQTFCRGQSPTPSGGEGGIVSGTGWLAPKGYIVTADHVVDGATGIELYQDGRQVGAAEVVASDPANDVAVLKPALPGAPHRAIALAPGPAQLGETIFTLGYPAPDIMGTALKMTAGEVNALAGTDLEGGRLDDVRVLQISAPIQPGNSGGPVLDDAGRAVGIVITNLPAVSETRLAQNVNYALKVAYVRALIEALPDLGGYAPPLASATRAAAIRNDESAVFLILAAKPAQSPSQ